MYLITKKNHIFDFNANMWVRSDGFLHRKHSNASKCRQRFNDKATAYRSIENGESIISVSFDRFTRTYKFEGEIV